MDKNPLTTIAVVIALGEAYTVYEAIVTGAGHLSNVFAFLQGIVFLTLYFRNPNMLPASCSIPPCRSFLFTSV